MFLLRQTMTSRTGGYITRRLHVPQEVWSQGGAKLTNVPEKIRVVEVLYSALEELQHWSAEFFGAGNVSSGLALGIGSIGRKEGELWASKLEDFSSVCDGVVGQFGKKLGVGEGFVTKKSSGVSVHVCHFFPSRSCPDDAFLGHFLGRAPYSAVRQNHERKEVRVHIGSTGSQNTHVVITVQLGFSGTLCARALEVVLGSTDPRRTHQGCIARRHRAPLRRIPPRHPRGRRDETPSRVRVLRQGRAHVRHPRHGPPP